MLHDVGKAFFENGRDTCVQLFAAAAQQACISCVADKGMFERVGCCGRDTAGENKAGIAEPAQRLLEIVGTRAATGANSW